MSEYKVNGHLKIKVQIRPTLYYIHNTKTAHRVRKAEYNVATYG